MISGRSVHSEGGKESYPCPWLRFTFTNRIFGTSSFGLPRSTSQVFIEGKDRSYSLGTMGDALNNSSSTQTNNEKKGNNNTRTGLFAVTDSVEDMKFIFPFLLKMPSKSSSLSAGTGHVGSPTISKERKIHALHIIIMRGPVESSVDANSFSKDMTEFLRSHLGALLHCSVSRVSFFVGTVGSKWRGSNNFGGIFTFRAADKFAEDDLFSNIEAPHAFHLDLPRLSNFDIIHGDGQHTTSGNVHIYKAVPKGQASAPHRYFARSVAFTSEVSPSLAAEAEAIIVETLDTLALVIGQERAKHDHMNYAANHIFLNVVAPDTGKYSLFSS